MTLTNEQLREMSDDINGTCKSVSDILQMNDVPDGGEEEDQFNQYLQDVAEVQLCSTCDWWCEMDELEEDDSTGGYICQNCRE